MQSISDPAENVDGALKAAVSLVSTLSKHLKEVAVEMADMSFDEFERGAELLGDLAAARTLDSTVEIETGYLKCAQSAVSRHALRLRDLYAAVGQEMTKPLAGIAAHLAGPA